MSTPSQSHQDAVSSPRPVVAVLGDPGTHGAMVKLLRDSGAEVIVTSARLTAWWLPVLPVPLRRSTS